MLRVAVETDLRSLVSSIRRRRLEGIDTPRFLLSPQGSWTTMWDSNLHASEICRKFVGRNLMLVWLWKAFRLLFRRSKTNNKRGIIQGIRVQGVHFGVFFSRNIRPISGSKVRGDVSQRPSTSAAVADAVEVERWWSVGGRLTPKSHVEPGLFSCVRK